MKKLLMVGLVAATILPSQAQLFSREALGGAGLGGLAGGIIGHNSGRHTAEGIGIGAGVGLLLGAMTANSRRDRYEDYSYQPEPTYYRRPNYAVTGAVLGGVAGGVIGHNNGRQTLEGVAIGAGAGLLLGAVAESEARRRETVRATLQPAYVVTQPATVLTTTPTVTQAVAQPQQVSVVNNSYFSSENSSTMSSANALFGR